MPGLAGFITPRLLEHHRSQLASMVEVMSHEEFYSTDCQLLDQAGLGVGWALHRAGYSDCLPIWNEARDICLFFSGEHFAPAAEVEGLKAAGHRSDQPDAGWLVHLYEQAGDDFFNRLNGTFSGVIADLRQNKVILFNDRFGLGRLYIHESADGLYFASEAKALLQVLPQLRNLDLRGVGELLICGCTQQDRTLFKGVSLLPPGSKWTFQPGHPVRKQNYFALAAWEQASPLGPEEYYSRLKEVFNRILPRYFAGGQPVGLSLTGGLDSRMIIAGLDRAPGSMPCYTFGGMYRDCADVRLARRIAHIYRQPHTTIPVDQRFFSRFLELAHRCVYLTDGAMDVSGAVGLYANRLAREIAPVRMTGNYGSEILRANIAFKAGSVMESLFSSDFVPHLKQATETFRSGREGLSRLAFIVRKQVPWHHYSRLAEEQSQLTIRAPYLDNELVPLAFQAPAGQLLNKQLAYRYTAEMHPALARVPTDRGLLNPPPLVPRRMFEFAQELLPHAEYRFDYGMPHWLAKIDRVIAPLHLERLLLGRQKYYHFRTWYRHALASQVKEVLLDPRTLNRTYLNRREVESIVLNHTRGTGNFTTEIHKLMTLELIQRQLIEQPIPVATCT